MAAAALGLRALRPRARTGAGATLVVALTQQRFLAGRGLGFPNAYFKIASLITPVAISLMVAGLLMGTRQVHGWRCAGPFPTPDGRPRFDLEGAETVWASPPLRLLRAQAVAPR